MSGEQAVVEDEGYVRLGGQTLQVGGVVCGCRVRRCLVWWRCRSVRCAE